MNQRYGLGKQTDGSIANALGAIVTIMLLWFAMRTLIDVAEVL